MRKGQVNKLPKLESELNTRKDKEYKVEVIKDSIVYAEFAKSQLLDLHYLVSWKSYSENKGTWEPDSAILYLWKIISIFYKDHPEKSTATSPPLDSTLSMTTPTIKPTIKRKCNRLVQVVKQTKKA